MTTTHSIALLPDLATFVRDQLADYLDGLGHIIEAQDERDGFPCLSVEHSNGSNYVDIAVLFDRGGARFMDMANEGWERLGLPGFQWRPKARDTGVTHGPLNARETHADCFALIPLDGCPDGGTVWTWHRTRPAGPLRTVPTYRLPGTPRTR